MTAYFIRRFLLIIPTFLGITALSFLITRYVPGGPVEQAILRYQHAGAGGEGGGGGGSAGGRGPSGEISEEMVNKLKEIYGFDKPVWQAYLIWLNRLVHLDMGDSYRYSQPVWDVIKTRFPISLYFGIIGFVLSYSVCIPLGVFKAIKHGSPFDVSSSMLVFAGYAIPGFSLGVVLLVLLGGGSYWNVFPLGGFTSPNFAQLSLLRKACDLVWHTVLPVTCYMIGEFAILTVIMKNSLMENLGQDYVRTAFAKGLSEKVVIFKHAFRNSLIPIATGLGSAILLILSGSYFIEYVFNIHGFGYLGYEAIVERDYPVVLGILVMSSILALVGNILSDILYCVVEPRIRFE